MVLPCCTAVRFNNVGKGGLGKWGKGRGSGDLPQSSNLEVKGILGGGGGVIFTGTSPGAGGGGIEGANYVAGNTFGVTTEPF